ncbi:hypothetical protein D3C84_796130 [compost metagenome]
MVDFHAGEHQPLRLPIAEHLQDLRRDLVLIQRLELAIETNHRNQRPAIPFEQHRVDSRPVPTRLGKRLQGQHPQGRKIRTAVFECGFVGRRPLSLPYIKLLIERRCVLLFATAKQSQHHQQA